MAIKLGVVMDPLSTINFSKDTSVGLMAEAQLRGWQVYFIDQQNLHLFNGQVRGIVNKFVKLQTNQQNWYQIAEAQDIALADLDIILLRKDPPFDQNYLYTTYLLDLAVNDGCLVLNNPSGVRDANEKIFANWFKDCMPETLVTSSIDKILQFIDQHKTIILKPLDEMGGQGIFKVADNDVNKSVILATATQNNQKMAMAQRYLPEITQGDKRILLLDGEPLLGFALARIPASGEVRANLAAGGHGVGVELTERDLDICRQVAPRLQQKGLFLVGLDVIGDYLTEVNVTSPTCMRQLEEIYQVNLAKLVVDKLEEKL